MQFLSPLNADEYIHMYVSDFIYFLLIFISTVINPHKLQFYLYMTVYTNFPSSK